MTWENPKGTITNSDLEMAAELLGWLVLEGTVPLRHKHVGLCSDNPATVSWQMHEKKPRVTISHTPPCWQEKPSRRHSIEILWIQKGMAF